MRRNVTFSQLRRMYKVTGIKRQRAESKNFMINKLMEVLILNIDRQQCNSWTTFIFHLSSQKIFELAIILDIVNSNDRDDVLLRRIFERLEMGLNQPV